MDINNKNELQTQQGMDSSHMQKVNCSDKKSSGNTLLRISNVIDDRPTCDVNKVYKYMILVARSMLFIKSPKQIIFLHIENDTIEFKY